MMPLVKLSTDYAGPSFEGLRRRARQQSQLLNTDVEKVTSNQDYIGDSARGYSASEGEPTVTAPLEREEPVNHSEIYLERKKLLVALHHEGERLTELLKKCRKIPLPLDAASVALYEEKRSVADEVKKLMAKIKALPSSE